MEVEVEPDGVGVDVLAVFAAIGRSAAMFAQMSSAAEVHTTRFLSEGATFHGIVMSVMLPRSMFRRLKARPVMSLIEEKPLEMVRLFVAASRNCRRVGRSVRRFVLIASRPTAR